MAYDYSYEFQRSIVRLMLHDETFLLQYRGALDANWFTDAEHRAIASSILSVADATGGAASLGSVLEVLPDVLEADMDLDEAQDEARRMADDGVPKDAAFVREKVIAFGATARVEEVLTKAPDMLAEGNLAEFVDKVRDAAYVESAAASPLYDHLEEFEARMVQNKARAEDCVGFGLPSVDDHLEGGGLAAGEMCVLCGLPGFGKTETLVNIGANAIRKGKRVFHALIGDSPATRVSLRYDCNFTGQTVQQVRLNYKESYQQMKDLYEQTGGGGRLKVQWWPANTITPQDLEDYLRWLYTRHAWKPDVLIVDYGANMKPPRGHGDGGKRHEQGDIYKELNALAGKMGVPVYTAIQANRKDGVKAKTLTMDHFAEAFEPARDATLIVTVNMTEEERDAGIMRYFCAKYRDSEAFWTETLEADFKTHTIREPSFDPGQKTLDSGLQPGETVNKQTGEITGKLNLPPKKPRKALP